MKDVVIESLDLKYRGIANAKGQYRITRIAAGTYTFRFSAPGYEPQEQTVVFAPGIASKCDLTLKSQLLLVA
ncbi:MAG: carboxypeptidase-like regulatory domain-containing protein [Flavisolibacter sp.]